jgi:hypothetical protein
MKLKIKIQCESCPLLINYSKRNAAGHAGTVVVTASATMNTGISVIPLNYFYSNNNEGDY